MGQSALLAEVYNRADGDAPAVDLAAERRNGDFIRENRDWITACLDLSDGGLAMAAFEMAQAGGVGVQIDSESTMELFGETQACYLVACNFDQAEALMSEANKAGVPLHSVGKFTGSDVRFGGSAAPLEELSALYRTSFAEAFA